MSDKQIKWIRKMIKIIDTWISSNDMSHVWNAKYSHIKHMLHNGYLANHMSASSYRTSLIIAFLEDSCDKAKGNHQYYVDVQAGL